MKLIPDTEKVAVLRTDFTDDQAWNRLSSLISSPIGREGFRAYVTLVNDSDFADVTPAALSGRLPKDYPHSLIVLADSTTFTERDQPLMVVGLTEQDGKTFRALPTRIQAIENNLSIGNMDFEAFAEAVDGDGVFRGFRGETEEDYQVSTQPRPMERKKPSPPKTLLGRVLVYTYKLLRGKPRG